MPTRIVDRVAAHGEARQSTRIELRDDVGGVALSVEPRDVGARRHDRARGAIREPQHALDHLALLRHEDAGARAFGDEH